MLRNLNLALPIKKGAGVADRVIRFVAGYVRFAVEKDTGWYFYVFYDI